MKPVSTDRSPREERLLRALQWALDWIERCDEIPIAEGSELKVHENWEWAKSLVNDAS